MMRAIWRGSKFILPYKQRLGLLGWCPFVATHFRLRADSNVRSCLSAQLSTPTTMRNTA